MASLRGVTVALCGFIVLSTVEGLPRWHEGRAEKRPFTFDDLYDPQFSYDTFYPNWVSDTEYIERTYNGIQRTNVTDLSVSKVLVTDEVYSKTNALSWSLSPDEQYFYVLRDYKKQWRYSYNGSYHVYAADNGDDSLFDTTSDVQYMRWSPANSSLLYVQENDIYYLPSPDADIPVRITTGGSQNQIYNGVPDWVYEEEMIGTRHVIYWSPDGRFLAYLSTNDTNVNRIEFSVYNELKYPEMVSVAYPKAGMPNPVITLHVYDLEANKDFVVEAPKAEVGEDHLFSTIYWYPDSQAFLVSWMNRISNVCAPQLCQYNDTWSCDVVQAGIERSDSGWIGNGGIPFTPKFVDDADRSYITIFSNDAGYWHVAVVNPTTDEMRYLTNSSISVVTRIYAYDPNYNMVYFVAAAPEPGSRSLYRVSFTTTKPANVWECISCQSGQESNCQWFTPSFSPGLSYLVLNCGGPDVPSTTIQEMQSDGNYGYPETLIYNLDVANAKDTILWPTRQTGSFVGLDDVTFLYEMFLPENFDENKKYPLLIEVYGGPGFQKVRNRWTKRWAQTHMVSQYEIIVASFDGRGSGYRGDGIAHMLYKKLGQLEKKDTTELARFLTRTYDYIDADRIALWGWSYGGYTTTFTISEGSGVFKCGMAVAPLASRYYYDTIHTERYMDLPKDNVDGYEKCSILNSNLANFNLATYTIIHGTADDNVHFQNAALISKALVEADVTFDNFFYADEAHSINSGPNANKHIYKKLTKKTRECFGLAEPTGLL